MMKQSIVAQRARMADIVAPPQFKPQIEESFVGAFRVTMLVAAALALAGSGVAALWVEGGKAKGDTAGRAKGEG